MRDIIRKPRDKPLSGKELADEARARLEKQDNWVARDVALEIAYEDEFSSGRFKQGEKRKKLR